MFKKIEAVEDIKSSSKTNSNVPSTLKNEQFRNSFIKFLFIQGCFEELQKFKIELDFVDADKEKKYVIFHEEDCSYYLMEFNCFDETDNKIITEKEFLDVGNLKFSLFKYICAYERLKNEKYKTINNFIIFTNISFDLEKEKDIYLKEVHLEKEQFLFQINKIEDVNVKYFTIDIEKSIGGSNFS